MIRHFLSCPNPHPNPTVDPDRATCTSNARSEKMKAAVCESLEYHKGILKLHKDAVSKCLENDEAYFAKIIS